MKCILGLDSSHCHGLLLLLVLVGCGALELGRTWSHLSGIEVIRA